jgi:hypothetical protein
MSTPEELNPSDILVLKCQETLGTGKKYDMPHVLTCFETSMWALEENEELTPELKGDLVFAKNILLRHIVINQIKTIGQFKIESPFEGTCPKCRGAGEVYKFLRKSKKVKCMKCTDGVIILDCTSCGATGRYTKEIDEGDGLLHINVQCRTCKGKNIDGKSKKTQVQFKCPTCRGKKQVKKFAIVEEIKSTTPCKYCEGTGIKPKRPEKVLDNPVRPLTLGVAIQKDGEIPPEFVDCTSQSSKQALEEGCFQKRSLPPSD